jgi:hypothetical protein
MKKSAITAYGTQADRDKLAVLAKLTRKSSSEWLIDKIRSEYRLVFGEFDPDLNPANEER